MSRTLKTLLVLALAGGVAACGTDGDDGGGGGSGGSAAGAGGGGAAGAGGGAAGSGVAGAGGRGGAAGGVVAGAGGAAGGAAGAAGSLAGAGGGAAGAAGGAGAAGRGGAGGGVAGAGGRGGAAGGGGAAGAAGTGGGAGAAGAAGGAGAGGRGGAAGGGAGAGGRGGAAGSVAGAGGRGGAAGGGGATAYNPCPTNGNPCRILPLGDSITDGFNIVGGYRIELFRKTLMANQRITFTGSQTNGPSTVDGTTFPRNHEGHSGWRIDEIANVVPSPGFTTPPNMPPDIVLVMAGTNDVIQNNNLANAPMRLGMLLDEIYAASSRALVVVARLTPLQSNDAGVNTFNNAIPALVQSRNALGQHLILVDMHTGFPQSELADGIHPNAAGYLRMANVWYAAIGPLLP